MGRDPITFIVVENKTDEDLYVYYKSTDEYVLEVVIFEYPKSDTAVRISHKVALVHARSNVAIPLLSGWKKFNGIRFDATRIPGEYIRAEQFAVSKTGEYRLIIQLAPD